jgi:hypothetical protein
VRRTRQRCLIHCLACGATAEADYREEPDVNFAEAMDPGELDGGDPGCEHDQHEIDDVWTPDPPNDRRDDYTF